MAETETLREYVVRVLYAIDTNTEQKFHQSMRAASLEADLLARAIADVAKGIAESVLKIATNFDDLFFFGQRANANVRNIQGLSYAFSQLGLSGQEAMAAIQSVAAQLRTNPGVESWVNNLGVKTRDALGNLRDTVDVLADVNVALKKQPGGYAVASRQAAALLGIDEQTFNVIQGHIDDLKALREKYNAAAGRMGVNPDDAAEKANRVMSSVRDLQMQLGFLVDKLLQAFGPQISDALDKISKWIADHGDELKDAFELTASAVLRIVNHLVEFVEKMAPVMKSMDDFIYKILGTGGVQSAFEALLVFVAGRWLVGMTTAIGSVVSSLAPLILALGALYAGYSIGNWIGDRLMGPASSYVSTPSNPWDVNADPASGNWLQKTWRWGARKVLGLPDVAGSKGSSTMNGEIPPEGRAFLDAIAAKEAPGGYDTLYGGGKFKSWADHPRQSFIGPTGRPTSAAGRYQFLATTWDRIAKRLGLKDFSPKNQDTAAWYLANETYRNKTGRDLLTDLKSNDPGIVAAAAATMHDVWTSLPGGPEQGQGGDEFVKRYFGALGMEKDKGASPAPARLPPVDPSKLPWRRTSDDFWSPFSNAAPLAPSSVDNSVSKSASVNQTNHITINGAADATATALSIEASQSRLNNSLLTNMKSAVQ